MDRSTMTNEARRRCHPAHEREERRETSRVSHLEIALRQSLEVVGASGIDLERVRVVEQLTHAFVRDDHVRADVECELERERLLCGVRDLAARHVRDQTSFDPIGCERSMHLAKEVMVILDVVRPRQCNAMASAIVDRDEEQSTTANVDSCTPTGHAERVVQLARLYARALPDLFRVEVGGH
jgi:hypothetical protein